MKKTLYDLLGVRRTAGQDEIASAYERLRQRYHPDLPENTGNLETEARLKAIKEAYALLSDEKRRDAYDAALTSKTLATPPAEHKSIWSTNRIIIAVLVAFGAFAMLSQIYLQWQAVRASRYAMEQNQRAREEVAARERFMEYGPDGPPSPVEVAEAAEQRRIERDQEEQQRQTKSEEERRKREMEDFHRYGEKVAAERARAEEQARRKAVYEKQRLEEAQRHEQEEQDRGALQRLEAEKRRLRELEYQNRR
jgi:curved DNA-binding protein CbpA